MSRHLPSRLAFMCLALALLLTGIIRAAPGDIERVSVSSDEAQASGVPTGGTAQSAISGDGRYVAFESIAPNLVVGDTNNASDIFVRDRNLGTTTRVSVTSAGGQANGASSKPDISADGRTVVFWSYATNLTPTDLAGPEVFVHDRETGATTSVGLFSDFPAISGDGRWVAFQSTASSLVANDTNARTDIFVLDRAKGATTRVSVDGIGRQANAHSSQPDISHNGQLIAFESYASNLVKGDTNGFMDIFVHDRQTRTTQRVSVDSAGMQANNVSQYPAIDPNGFFVAFQSSATNLSAADTSGGRDIYLRELATGATNLASLDSSGRKLGGHSEFPTLSAGGRYVAFQTGGRVAGDTNSYGDVVVYDRQTGYTSLASAASDGTVGNSQSTRPAISAGGSRIAFWSYASNLVAGDTNGGADIFVKERMDVPPPGGGTADLAISNTIVPTRSQFLRPDSLLLTYEIRVVNNGPNIARDIVVTDNLPSSLTRMQCDTSAQAAITGNGNCQATENSAIVTRFELPPGATMGFQVVARVNDWIANGTPIDNTATVSSATSDPAPENNSAIADWTTPTSTKRPLILVPGVGGTQLINNAGEQWIALGKMIGDAEDKHLLTLRLAEDGAAPLSSTDPAYTSVRTGDILRKEANADIYKSTVAKLTAAGYRERVDLFAFPNDWRKDLRLNGLDLVTLIDRVRAQTGAAKVDILAHSQGGLITLVALENSGSVGKVNKAVTMGTPVLGATKALGMLEYQAPCFLDEVPGIGCPVNKAVLQTAFTNWPGAYALLPSRAFHQAVGSPLVIDRDTNGDGRVEGARSYDQWTAIIRANRNPTVLAKAEALHDMVDTLNLADPSVQLRRFIGTNISTPLYVREHTACFAWVFACTTAHEIKMGDGDGTVPRHSADLYNVKMNFDRRGGAGNHYYYDTTHAGLPIDDRAMQDAIAFFNAHLPSPADVPPEDLEGIELEGLGPFIGHVGLDATPGSPGAASAGIASDVPIDEGVPPANVLGRYPGQPDDVIWETLPGGEYNAIGDTQSFFLNKAESYTADLRMDAAAPGRLRVRGYDGGGITSQAVFNVDAPANAGLKLDFATAQDPASLRLNIDRDNNGTTDQVLAPSSVVSGSGADDTTAPVTIAQASSNGMVSLASQDELGGSGVADTFYMIVGTHTAPERYTAPFALPGGKVVRFGSVDRAGNMEVLTEFSGGITDKRVFVPLLLR